MTPPIKTLEDDLSKAVETNPIEVATLLLAALEGSSIHFAMRCHV
jgi:hypothetical protein